MIDTTAKRRMTLNGKTYQKGDTVPMLVAQYNDLGPDGIDWVERPAAKPATKSKSDDAAD